MKTVVFQIITHLEMGGAERIAFNIAKSKSKEFEYHIVEVARGNSAYTKEMIDTVAMIGLEIGKMILKRICVILHPSITAASSNSRLIPLIYPVIKKIACGS